jgi:hypothetical protein
VTTRRRRNERDPETPDEWQEAVNAAEFLTGLDSARQYGLITGGPRIDLQRCEEILRRGETLGYTPASLDTLISTFVKP